MQFILTICYVFSFFVPFISVHGCCMLLFMALHRYRVTTAKVSPPRGGCTQRYSAVVVFVQWDEEEMYVLLLNKETSQEVMQTKEIPLHPLPTLKALKTFFTCNYKLCQYLIQSLTGCSGEATGIYSSVSAL